MALGDQLIGTIKDPLCDPEAFVSAVELVDALELRFSCPSCRSVMTKKPIPAIAVEEVLCGLGIGEGGREGATTTEHLRQASDAFEQYLLF